ncbi:hypothetical protein FB645_005440 [Coemansia sp. IMI 203386]|nr:hypothetical protein FB645_005440 [Coemansia sp. IMI 203386]
MLSADVDVTANPDPGKGKGASSWLPELDSPKLSIALPPVVRDPEPPQAAVNEIMQPSEAADTKAVAVALASEAPAASQDAASPSSASSVAGADYYYQLDAIKSESSVVPENPYENPTEELHDEPPKALSLAETHAPLAPAPRSDVDMQTMLDHLGLDFDFASDPAIDDINATPLFAMPPSVAECAQPECESKHDLDPASQQPHQTRPALTDAPSSSGAKARVRRSSIASMLIRRTSKCFDSIGSSTASDSPVAKEQKPEAQSQVQPEPQAQAQVQAEDKTQVEDRPLPQSSGTDAVSGSASPKEPAQPSDEASAAASQEQAPVESSDTPPPYAHSNVDPAAVPAASPAPVADAASVFVAKALVEQTAASADPSAAEASSESYNASSAAESAEKSDSAASGSLQPSGDSPAASLSYEADKSTAAVTEPPSTQSIPARRPPMARNLDRRSSRFLDEITRKVQHVRQTTSMVLRRSVGSRLSVIPVAPSENMAAASTEDPSQHQLQSDSLPEQEQEQAQAQALQQVQRCDTAHASDKQVCVPDDAADQSDAAEDIQDADDHDSDNDNAKPVVAATAEGSAHQRGGLARRFTFVRRGTNEAVRNSVSRVKGIFASKKSVAA